MLGEEAQYVQLSVGWECWSLLVEEAQYVHLYVGWECWSLLGEEAQYVQLSVGYTGRDASQLLHWVQVMVGQHVNHRMLCHKFLSNL